MPVVDFVGLFIRLELIFFLNKLHKSDNRGPKKQNRRYVNRHAGTAASYDRDDKWAIWEEYMIGTSLFVLFTRQNCHVICGSRYHSDFRGY